MLSVRSLQSEAALRFISTDSRLFMSLLFRCRPYLRDTRRQRQIRAEMMPCRAYELFSPASDMMGYRIALHFFETGHVPATRFSGEVCRRRYTPVYRHVWRCQSIRLI